MAATVTWHSNLFPCWGWERPLVRQTGRDFAELHYVVVDASACAAVVFDDHVALDVGVRRECTSAVRACRTTLEFVAFFRKHRNPVKQFSSAVRHGCVWRRFRVARSPLSFRPNGQDVSAFTENNRDLRRQTGKRPKMSTQKEVRWSKRRWRTNPRHLFRNCDATLHVRGFRHITAEAVAVLRCMWPEKAHGMMQELYDDGFQHPGRRTLLRARIRLNISYLLLRRRWFNSDRWHSQPQRSLHLQVGASPIASGAVFWYGLEHVQWRHILDPIVDAGGLAGLWARSLCRQDNGAIAVTVVSCGSGVFKTFEDVYLSIRSITTQILGSRQGFQASITSCHTSRRS